MKRRRVNKTTIAAIAGVSLIAGPVAAACDEGPTYEAWAATDGAAGRINLDEVQEAFKQSDSASTFEGRVNAIYEGDGVVLIRVEQDGEKMVLEGWEDLNSSGVIEDATDDRLFSIVEAHDTHEMTGYGANSYYRSSFGAGNFLFSYLLLRAVMPVGGYYSYRTPRQNYDTISRNRSGYRNSANYRNQVSRNTRYFQNQKSFRGSAYDQAGRSVSSSRQSYLSNQRSSGAFKSSGTGVRSSWGSSSRGSSFGRSGSGFTGGGGTLRRG